MMTNFPLPPNLFVNGVMLSILPVLSKIINFVSSDMMLAINMYISITVRMNVKRLFGMLKILFTAFLKIFRMRFVAYLKKQLLSVISRDMITIPSPVNFRLFAVKQEFNVSMKIVC